MKKIVVSIIFLFAVFIMPAYAEEGYSDEFRNSVKLEESLLSEDADLNDIESLRDDLKAENIFSFLWKQIRDSFDEVLKGLIGGIGLILLSVILNRSSGNIHNQNLQLLFSFIVSITVVLMCEKNIRQSAVLLSAAIENMSVFTAACIPSFSVVMIAAGENAGASVFSASMVLLGEIGTLLSNNLMLPLVNVYLAIGICSAVSDEYNFAAIGKNIRKFLVWMIGILVVIFRMIMKLQVSAAAAGDRIAQKYIRSAVGGMIPIVGNTLSQGVDGLFAVAIGVKTSFAVAGVLIVLSIMVPCLIKIGLYGLIWSICGWVAAFMNDSMMKSVSSILANGFYLMLALGGCVALMGIISFLGIMSII